MKIALQEGSGPPLYPSTGGILVSMSTRTPPQDRPAGRVLVVDEEKPLAQMVATYLTRAGFHTTEAHSAIQAVDDARRRDPDVVVLDLGLPEIDGRDGGRRVRTCYGCYTLVRTHPRAEGKRTSGM